MEAPIPSDLIRALKRSRCVLFVGAGVSAGPGGLPSGTELASKLAQAGGLCNCKYLGGTRDCAGIECCCHWPLQRIAQYYEVRHGRWSLNRFLKDVFDSVSEPLPPHMAIASLHARFAAVVTTNYDRLLENAFERIHQPCDLVIKDISVSYVESRPILIKMHGCISDPDTIVITEDDYVYKSFFEERRLIASKLLGYFADHVILFLGYSLEDSTFRNLYHDVARRLGKHKVIAYAVQKSPCECATEYWKEHKVRILDCDTLVFLQQVETELASDIDDLRALLENTVSAFQKDGSLMKRNDMEAVKERLDVLSARSALNPEMREVLVRSAMHWYRDPSTWLGLISDVGVLERIAAQLLTSENPQARENAVLLARDLRLESAVPELLLALRSPNSSVCRAASTALVSMGNQTVAELLLSLSQDERIASIALETFSNLSPTVATPVFQTHLSKATTAERREILRQLGRVQRKIMDQFGTRSGETFVQCASIALGSTEEEFFGTALQLLEDARLDSAADCLAEFVLSDAPWDRRGQVILAVGGFRTRRATKLWEGFLGNDEEWVRESALKAIRELLTSRRRWTPEDNQVRQMAADAIVATEYRSPETLALLRDLTRDSDEWIQSSVLQSLDRFFDSDELPDILRDVLLAPKRLPPEDDQVRRTAVNMLVATEDRSPETLALLRDLTRDSDEWIRSLVLQNFGRFFNSKELLDV